MNLIGVDLGIHKVALAIYSIGDFGFTLTQAVAKEFDADQTRDVVLRELSHMVADIAVMWDARWVWIEDTLIGNNRKYSIGLAETKGAVLAQLSWLRAAQGTDIRWVNNMTWKKEVLGKGNASKAEIRNHILVTHPAYAPLCGDDQDLYDAACVGLYGLDIVNRASQLSL